MPATATFRAPRHMPPGMSVPEWRAMVKAARTNWLGYVLPFYEVVLNGLGLAMIFAWHSFLGPGELDLFASPPHTVAGVLGFLLTVRMLRRSVDWSDKRRLAYKVGLLPDAIREY